MPVLSRLRGTLRLLFILAALVIVAAGLALLALILLPFPSRSRRTRSAFVTRAAQAVLVPLGVRVSVNGNPPAPPFFLVCNHLGYMDILVLRAVTGTEFVSKAEIAAWPVIGQLARLSGTLFLDRRNKRDVSRINRQVATALESGCGLTVFPEGTSTAGSAVGRFHAGLLEVPAGTGLPVHAAALRYTTPAGIDTAQTVCWWGDMTFLDHLYRLLSIPHFDAIVSFAPNPVAAFDRKALASSLHARVSEQFAPIDGSPSA